MAIITPSSTVSLYSGVPITTGQQLIFKTEAEQSSYFLSKRVANRVDCSYIRKTGRLRLEYSASVVSNADYLSFKNVDFENKTFYAQVLDFEYVSNTTTDIIYSIDWFQTYMFDMEINPCYILRQHASEGDYNNNVNRLVPRDGSFETDEGLPVGEALMTNPSLGSLNTDSSGWATTYGNVSYASDITNYLIISLSHFNNETWAPEDLNEFLDLFDYYGNSTGIPTSLNNSSVAVVDHFVRATSILGIKVDYVDYSGENHLKNKLSRALELLALYNNQSSIVSMYVLPRWFLAGYFKEDGFQDNVSGFTGTIPVNFESYDLAEFVQNKDLIYDPKIRRFPYSYLQVKSPNDTKEYKYELFNDLYTDSEIRFKVVTNINGSPIMSFMPMYYKGAVGQRKQIEANYNERIDYSDFPQVAYSIDAYSAFLGQQYQSAMTKNTNSGIGQMITNNRAAINNQNMQPLNAAMNLMTGGLSSGASFVGSGVGSVIGGAGGMINGVTGYMPQAYQNEVNVRNAQNDITTFLEADRGVRGQITSTVFEESRRAYNNDIYTPGGNGGFIPYSLNIIDFKILSIRLRNDVAIKYSNYFKLYGYKDGSYSIPNISYYIKNSNDVGSLPKFLRIWDNDKSKYITPLATYLQTENASVSGIPHMASKSIENLFNAGCRFLKVV